MMIKLTVLFLLISLGACKMCDKKNAIDISNGTFLQNGDIVYNNITFNRNDYFEKHDQLKGCVYEKKLLKCCPFGTDYYFAKNICRNTTELFDPPVVDDDGHLQKVDLLQHFNFSVSRPTCEKTDSAITLKLMFNDISIRKNGSLYTKIPKPIPSFLLSRPDKYCVDTFITGEGGSETTSFDVLICLRPDEETEDNSVSTIGMLISCVFILATVAVYGWLPELRNLHGRVLMAYLICLFVGFAVLATMQILLLIDNISSNCCVGLTIIIYFALLSAFFWLNIMCFDIWWTFSGKRGTNFKNISVRGKFLAYSIYAFGIPSALTILMAALEFSVAVEVDSVRHPLFPNIRLQGCFLSGHSKLLYLYGPIVILWFANLIFFILTAVKIAQIKRQTSVLKSRDSATHDQQNSDRQRLFLYVKLFIMMGVNWLLEVISSLYPQADLFWRFTDAYNVLTGVIVFIIFVCKRKIFRLIKKRYKQVRGVQLSKSQSSTRTYSTRDEVALTSRN